MNPAPRIYIHILTCLKSFNMLMTPILMAASVVDLLGILKNFLWRSMRYWAPFMVLTSRWEPEVPGKKRQWPKLKIEIHMGGWLVLPGLGSFKFPLRRHLCGVDDATYLKPDIFSAGKGPSNFLICRHWVIGSGWWTLVMVHSCGWNYLLAILPLKHLWCLGQVSGGTELEWVHIVYVYIRTYKCMAYYTHCGHMTYVFQCWGASGMPTWHSSQCPTRLGRLWEPQSVPMTNLTDH